MQRRATQRQEVNMKTLKHTDIIANEKKIIPRHMPCMTQADKVSNIFYHAYDIYNLDITFSVCFDIAYFIEFCWLLSLTYYLYLNNLNFCI